MTKIMRDFISGSAVIAAGSSVSGSLSHAARPLLGLAMPDGWSGGACLLFQVSTKAGGAFNQLCDDTGTLVSVPVASGRAYCGDAFDSAAQFFAIKFASGSIKSGVFEAIDQASARTFLTFSEG